jgi:chorismate-pyruvate lyase
MSFHSVLSRTEVLFPLKLFYEMKGKRLPYLEAISGDEIPFPAKELLVHDEDMTSNLEAFYKKKISIDVFYKDVDADAVSREVVLCLEGSGKPVEYGAIRIDLSNIPENVRELILECKQPLGGILNENRVQYKSNPKSFFRIMVDDFIMDALQLANPHFLFGRCNVLTTSDDRILANVVEILSPIDYWI